MPAEPVSRRWWRYAPFGMRGLIVLVLLIAIGLGWLVRRRHIQRDAVAAIREAGGQADYRDLVFEEAGTDLGASLAGIDVGAWTYRPH